MLVAAGFLLAVVGSPSLNAAEPALFGSAEIRGRELAAFTKWTGMLDRLDAETIPVSGFGKALDAALNFIPAGDVLAELSAVNRMVNAVQYIADDENWGANDHWSTPEEFYSRSGDCEDFAIAKYVALKRLGFDPEKMRIVVLVDEKLDRYHAVLMVGTPNGRMILDNQIEAVLRDTDIGHYRPVYSINESAWWLHVEAPQKRLVAHLNK